MEGVEGGARAFVETAWHGRHTAKGYAEALGRCPAPRVNRKSLIAMRLALARESRKSE